MTKTKRHHLVPQFYLRRFADQKERVSAKRLSTNQNIKTHVKNAAVESGFYTILQDDLPDNFIEEGLADVEGAAERVFRSLDQGAFSLTEEDRLTISLFIAVQYTRTRDWRERYFCLGDFIARMLIDLQVHGAIQSDNPEGALSTLGLDPDVDVPTLVEIQKELPNLRLEPHQNQVVKDMFKIAIELAPLLLNRNWCVLTSRKRAFLTCDRPVTLYRESASPEDHRGIGFLTASEIYFPIDSYKSLALTYQPVPEYLAVQPWIAKKVNQLVVLRAPIKTGHGRALKQMRAQPRVRKASWMSARRS